MLELTFLINWRKCSQLVNWRWVCSFTMLLTEFSSSRGMFARPASETSGPA